MYKYNLKYINYNHTEYNKKLDLRNYIIPLNNLRNKIF